MRGSKIPSHISNIRFLMMFVYYQILLTMNKQTSIHVVCMVKKEDLIELMEKSDNHTTNPNNWQSGHAAETEV